MRVSVLTFGSIKTDWRVIKSAYMFDKLGHKVTLATFFDEDKPHECRINDRIVCTHLKFGEVAPRRNRFRISRWRFKRRNFFHLLRASKYLKNRLYMDDFPDLIYLHEMDTLFCAVLLKLLHNDFKNTKFVYDAHELERARWPLRHMVIRASVCLLEYLSVKYLRASVVTVGREYANYLERSWPHYSRVRVIGNKPSQIPLNDYSRSRNFSATVIPKFSNGLPTAVMSGNVTFNRGIEQVFEAMTGKYPFNLVFVGELRDLQKRYFRKFIEGFGIENNVRFVGPLSYQLVSDYLSHFDFGIIGVVPLTKSYELSCPNKLYELYNTKLPAIVSDLPEIRSFKKNMNLSEWFLCDVLNPSEISRCVKRINEHLNSRQIITSRRREPMYFNSDDDFEIYKCLLQEVP